MFEERALRTMNRTEDEDEEEDENEDEWKGDTHPSPGPQHRNNVGK